MFKKSIFFTGDIQDRKGHYFVVVNSPFYNPEIEDMSFKSYCYRNGYEDID
jgi:hypothetical protein